MPIIEWNVSFLLGIQELDQHHQYIVQLLNRIYDDFRDGAMIQQSSVDEIVDFARGHFACEERWMTETSYPKVAEHIEEHKLFDCRLMEFQNNCRKNKNISVELLWFLCNWVTHHIRETDADLGHFADIQTIRKRMGRESKHIASK